VSAVWQSGRCPRSLSKSRLSNPARSINNRSSDNSGSNCNHIYGRYNKNSINNSNGDSEANNDAVTRCVWRVWHNFKSVQGHCNVNVQRPIVGLSLFGAKVRPFRPRRTEPRLHWAALFCRTVCACGFRILWSFRGRALLHGWAKATRTVWTVRANQHVGFLPPKLWSVDRELHIGRGSDRRHSAEQWLGRVCRTKQLPHRPIPLWGRAFWHLWGVASGRMQAGNCFSGRLRKWKVLLSRDNHPWANNNNYR